MKANNLEELVTNSNIAGELRNYTDWHTRLVKFAQVVADWQKEQMLKGAVEAEVQYFGETQGVPRTIKIPRMQEWLKPFKDGDKVRIVVLKAGEE